MELARVKKIEQWEIDGIEIWNEEFAKSFLCCRNYTAVMGANMVWDMNYDTSDDVFLWKNVDVRKWNEDMAKFIDWCGILMLMNFLHTIYCKD